VYVSVDDVLCERNGACPAEVRGMLARYDGVHFTSRFSRLIVPVIVRRATEAGVPFTTAARAARRSASGGRN
jgi:hypothetical protein